MLGLRGGGAGYLQTFSSTLEVPISEHLAVMSPETLEMVALARRYCEVIEASCEGNGDWLREVTNLLPRLHAAIRVLQPHNDGPDGSWMPDFDARFELFSHLHGLLGDRDGYWLEYDRVEGGQSIMTGSLADDLTDIYCELKQGLMRFDGEPQRALAVWRTGFRCHWGQHLVDAERHLYSLETRGRLESHRYP